MSGAAHDYARYGAFAHRLADTSARVTLPYFRLTALEVQSKGHSSAGQTDAFDPVTQADQEAELAIRAMISAEYPQHGLLGEEHGHQPGAAPMHWVIDPIDGTRAFITGNPQWGTLIALNDGVRPVLGVLDQPYTGERWIAWPGHAQFVSRATDGSGLTNARSLRTRRGVRLEQAVISSTHPWSYFTEGEQRAFRALDAKVRMSRFGGDCYAYGLLALGLLDAVIETSLKPWDIQALIPIIEGAGGVVTRWDGSDAQQGGPVVACGDRELHARILCELESELEKRS
jgi:histidinol phosphatase-like enzyme (inositol monophosphatase family)